jgi:hypothetical protein
LPGRFDNYIAILGAVLVVVAGSGVVSFACFPITLLLLRLDLVAGKKDSLFKSAAEITFRQFRTTLSAATCTSVTAGLISLFALASSPVWKALGIDIPIPLSNEVSNTLFYLAVWLSLIGVPLAAYIVVLRGGSWWAW